MGKPSGGGGVTQNPTLYTPSGLYQGLSEIEGLGSYGQSLLNPLASMTNWASSIATGGNAQGIGNLADTQLVTGPQINIGGGHGPGDQWTTQFNPGTGQVTLTNTQTGEQFNEAWNSPTLQQWFSNQGGGPQTLQQWGNLYQQAQKGTAVGGGGGSGSPFGPNGAGGGSNPMLPGGGNSLYGPQLSTAWDQILGIGNTEAETQATTLQAQEEAGTLLHDSMTGMGTLPSQTAWIKQGETAEENTLANQLAAEGLTSSTAAGVLKGEALQQGAATAGQLIQGNINLAQSAQKIALAGQELTMGEQSAMAGLALGFQSQMWTQAMQGYGALGSMLSTLGNLYGVDIQGYSNVLNSHVQENQIQAQIAEANAQLAAGSASAMGSGLGSIFGMLGGSGSGGSGGLLGGLGSLFGGIGGGLSSIIGVGSAAGGAASATGAGVDAVITAVAAVGAEAARSRSNGNHPLAYRIRDWMIWDAPKWLRKLYTITAPKVRRILTAYPGINSLIFGRLQESGE
jgi:hypothetical protein